MTRVVICGVGALGSSVAVLLRNLDAELAFVDFDRVESKNLAAQAFTKAALGKNKAEALRLQFTSFWGKKTEAFAVRLGADNASTLLKGATLAIDAFDNQASRLILSDVAKALGVPLVHAAITGDGTFGIVRWDERFFPDAEGAPGQATCEGGEHLPFIGSVAAALARIVQDHLLHGTKRDAMINLAAVQPF
jgi:molybdopterin-synthase adenylyltransferase